MMTSGSRGFDAKKLYRDRVNTFNNNTTKARRPLDLKALQDEVYSKREPMPDVSTDEQNEWQAPQSAFEDEPMIPEYLQEPPKKMPVIKQQP